MITPARKDFPAVDCETASDNSTRQFCSTNASIYPIDQAAVAFPRLERRSVRVGAGGVLNPLNTFLKRHAFGPNVAASSQSTLGGHETPHLRLFDP